VKGEVIVNGTTTLAPHGAETFPWVQQGREGSRADREFSEVTVSLPPHLHGVDLAVDAELSAALEQAMQAITKLDSTHGVALAPLRGILLRAESVASSKIEQITAGIDDYARALHGVKSNPSAVAMAAATRALQLMVPELGGDKPIDLDTITRAHELLMIEDPAERPYAGKLRDVQNWIGGSDFTPRGAMYVPPPPDTVPSYLNDLVGFGGREDLPALLQAAVAHAQFESIHPFTDGNGRIGRALINAVLRRRGATTQVVVPIASALVADRDRYFGVLTSYRDGRIRPLVSLFAESCRVAAMESTVSARHLDEVRNGWVEQLGSVRSGSATAKLVDALPANPVISAEDAVNITGGAESRVYEAIARLVEAEVLRPLTDRKRNQVWGAGLILDELEDLDDRIATSMG
jgi:Fic family protein